MASKHYHIGNLDCPNCARELQDGVSKLPDISYAQLDFSQLKLTVEGDFSEDDLRKRVEAFGHTLHAVDDAPTQQHNGASGGRARGGVWGFWDYLLQNADTRQALMGAAIIALGLVLSLFGLPEAFSSGLYTAALAIAVLPIARSGVNTLRINRRFSIDLLMTIASVGALVLGEFLEAAMVIFLFSVGEALEGYVGHRARSSIQSLLELKPDEATLLRGDQEEVVPVEQLAIGDVIVVKPGERVPMDGRVIAGRGDVNQAPITGESLPIAKQEGDEVFAGSINESGALDVEVTRLAENNTLSRIIQLVQEAQSRQAPSQRMIDQFAQYYTPAVVVVATLVAIVPPLLFGAPFVTSGAEPGWLYRALTILVIACPCALVISTPVTVISAITAAARRGVLIKGGAHLEALGTVQAIAFDKTGTLTAGHPAVQYVRSSECDGRATCDYCDDVLALAAAVERRSTHPLAQAVVQEAQTRQVAERYRATDVTNMSGQGIHGTVNGNQVTVGSHALFEQRFGHSAELCRQVQHSEARGHSTMLLHDGERTRGYIAVADQVRESSAAVLKQLHELKLQTIMLTGDNEAVAQAVAGAVGVQDVRASLLPQDKVQAVEGLLERYGNIAMVGDGVNDTPALATATVGIAMGAAGTAQAMETADVVLMRDDLHQIPALLRLARFARRLILENIALAFGMKLLFLVLAVGGGVTMWAAVFADVGMSLIVTLNGMRPLRKVRSVQQPK